MTEELEVGQRVRRSMDGPFGRFGKIVHIEDNVALVKYGPGDNRMIKLSELVSAEPAKAEPLKPGWYAIKKKYNNFLYYAWQVGDTIMYTAAYNPQTGEMDKDPLFPIGIAKTLIGAQAGDLTRMKFVPDMSLTSAP